MFSISLPSKSHPFIFCPVVHPLSFCLFFWMSFCLFSVQQNLPFHILPRCPSSTLSGLIQNFPGNKIRFGRRLLVSCRYLQQFLSKCPLLSNNPPLQSWVVQYCISVFLYFFIAAQWIVQCGWWGTGWASVGLIVCVRFSQFLSR